MDHRQDWNGLLASFRSSVAALEADLDASVRDLSQRRFVHSSRGAEVAAFVVTEAMADTTPNYVLYYRCHAWLLALGAMPGEVAAAVRKSLPLSPMQPVLPVLPVRFISVTVGSQLPVALGLALAGVGPVVASLGDGALSTGVTLETINAAAVLGPDLLFVVEDNGRAVTTPAAKVVGASPGDLADAYSLPFHRVDSAEEHTLDEAIQWVRSTAGGPRLLHVLSCTPDPHCLAYASSATSTR